MKRLILALLLPCLLAGPSFAEKWTQVWKNDDGTAHYVDNDSIKKKGNIIYFWGKFIPTGEAKKNITETFGKNASEFLSYNIINCTDMKAGNLKMKVIDDKGKTISSEDIPEKDVSFQKIETESPILSYSKLLCSPTNQ